MEMGRDNSSLNVKVRVIIWNLSPLWVVKVVMGRRLLGVFMTVYMPTILINVIGHSTNYFSDLYFEAVISVNLTASIFKLQHKTVQMWWEFCPSKLSR